jgi:hypothetical protein
MAGKSTLPSPAITQLTFSPLKPSLALSEVDCCHSSRFGTNLLLFEVFKKTLLLYYDISFLLPSYEIIL